MDAVELVDLIWESIKCGAQTQSDILAYVATHYPVTKEEFDESLFSFIAEMSGCITPEVYTLH